MTREDAAPPRALSPVRTVSTESPPAPAQRIAILFQDFAAGGTERIMVRLANEWARSREVAIFCGSESGPARSGVSAGVQVFETTPATPRSLLSRWILGRKLSPMLRRWRPDVIVGPGNHMLPVILASDRTATPIVCKLSNPIDPATHSMIPSGWLAGVRRRACAPLTQIVAMSPSLRDEAARYLRTDHVTVISEPILAALPAPIHRRPKRPRRRIVFAGRLVAQKNVALALRTLALLPAEMTLTIVGDGPDRARLEALSLRLGLAGRVRFVGFVADIAPYLTDADLFLLPSRFEGYPAVLIEALAAGLPVVATACSPAMPEIVSDPSFGKIAHPDPIALAAAILSLEQSDGPDPDLLAAFLARHSLDTAASRWLACLDEVVQHGVARL
ncbi:glycosyltransferase [Sphingomonas oryzagri]|uniref:Glycosyltransferase n=1 Tax=Sphingomonas oryzagri TaxID=3042314 RepID=A0ABT6MWM9_9SPHN|nr:glycosyltransferase [Sphingomonas oryzagri]MDH7637381.1 glycosyltransferase [Sphingomonas oryzagri]